MARVGGQYEEEWRNARVLRAMPFVKKDSEDGFG